LSHFLAPFIPLVTTTPEGADTLVTGIQAGTNPSYIGADPTNSKVYVSNTNSEGTVTVIDGSTNTAVTTLTVGSWPRGIAVNPATNKIYSTDAAGSSTLCHQRLNKCGHRDNRWSGVPSLCEHKLQYQHDLHR
jgi:YVTN family beta-propeller protein